MASITVNGRKISFTGSNMTITNGKVFVDGKLMQGTEQNEKEINIIVEGNIDKLECDGDINNLECSEVNNVSVGNNLNCGVIKEGASAGNNINCDNIYGNATAGNNIKCGEIQGHATAGNKICKN
jgi:hypothetical protein